MRMNETVIFKSFFVRYVSQKTLKSINTTHCINKKKLRTFIWEAGTVVEGDIRQSKKKEQKRGFLIFLHLSCHQFCFLKDLKLLGWLVSKAV